MTFFGNRDFYTEVQKDNIPGHMVVFKFGRNPDVDTAAIEDLWTIGGVRTWLQAASTLEAISDDAADDIAGVGARTITIEGLDATFAEVTEDVDMAGLSASTATTSSFIRINRVFVKETGTYGSTTTGGNLGNITIRLSGAGVDQAEILNEVSGTVPIGESQESHFTIPLGKTGFINSVRVTVDASKAARILFFKRERADDIIAPMGSPRLLFEEDGIKGPSGIDFDAPSRKIPEKTDIWAAGIASGANSPVEIVYEILLVDNSILNC